MLADRAGHQGVGCGVHQSSRHAGYLLFDQVRWRSQVQLQGMQVIAFLLVATGNYLDTGSRSSLMFQVLVQLPSIGAYSKIPGQDLTLLPRH